MNEQIYFVRTYSWNVNCSSDDDDSVADFCKGNAEMSAAFRSKERANKFVKDLITEIHGGTEIELGEENGIIYFVKDDVFHAYEICELTLN